MTFKLGEDQLTSAIIFSLARNVSQDYVLSETSKQRLRRYRDIVDKALASGETYYGINTGFGYLSDVKIDPDKLEQLQINLVRSHACGVGNYVGRDISRALLLLRAHTFGLGHTGISLPCVEKIIEFLEKDITPAIPEKGSVGASGDLAPLAHLALPLMGEGHVVTEGGALESQEVLAEKGVKPYRLQPKEGLSLINGTHFMTVIAAFAVEEARTLCRSADIILALSLDALRGTTAAFDERIQGIRPQVGQKVVAENILNLFSYPDDIQKSHEDCGKVQDPYSFRCAPQVHGATRDAVTYTTEKVNIELNSITDNPLCFDNGDIISGGNFHGQPMALAMDFLKIAVAELGNISERRIEKLTNPNMSGLPPFVTSDSGLNSGFMIPHVVAAALVSENKILCHPASIDSIPTSADKEDHVSMGPIAARKAREVIDNVASVLAIEILTACQGVDLIAPLKPNRILYAVYQAVRNISSEMPCDRSLHQDISLIAKWIKSGELVKVVEAAGIDIK